MTHTHARTHTHKHTHIHRNCFPVVALGKLKLHYGPPEGSGERGIEEEEKSKRKREKEGGRERGRGERRASVLFFSALAIMTILQ